jgi:hypothetical protein
MGRVYAGILGPLAMAVMICRGWLDSGGIESTLYLATIYLVVFAIAGAVIGQIAQSAIDESVRSTLEEQLTQQSAKANE